VEVATLQSAAMEGMMLRRGRPIHMSCVMNFETCEHDKLLVLAASDKGSHVLWP
jgi:hypothetical protein